MKKLTKKQQTSLDEVKGAIMVARGLFGEATAENVFGMVAPGGIHERVFGQEDEEVAHEDLKRSVELAKELFATTKPTVDLVFGVFDSIFVEYDSDDEDQAVK